METKFMKNKIWDQNGGFEKIEKQEIHLGHLIFFSATTFFGASYSYMLRN